MNIPACLPAQTIITALLVTFTLTASAARADDSTTQAKVQQQAPQSEVKTAPSSTNQESSQSTTASQAQAPVETELEDLADKPFEAVWPEGWKTKVLPGPLTNSGIDLGGKRVRSMKIDNGIPTVIELTFFPRRDKGQSNIAEEIKTVLSNIKSGYETKGFSSEIGPVQNTKLSKLESNEAIVTVTAPAFKMLQSILLTQSEDYFYSLTFTGRQSQYDLYKPSYDRLRSSLVLK